MKTIGRHLIAEYYGCPTDLLDDVDTVRAAMMKAVDVVGATHVGDTFHKFAPQGVTGVVVIAESHLSIHTWPENGYAAVDIFTCGGLDPRAGFESLGRDLAARSCRVQEIVRGLPDDVADSAEFTPENVAVREDVHVITHLRETELNAGAVSGGSAVQ